MWATMAIGEVLSTAGGGAMACEKPLPNLRARGDGVGMPALRPSGDDSPARGERVAVITGGHGGLGLATADALRAAGWDVRAPGHTELDVTDPATVDQWFATLGHCDLLVNNAGVIRDSALARMTEHAWDQVIATNLSGAARCARAVLPKMRAAGGGAIINIGSFTGIAGTAGQANYAAAKAGLIGLTRALAKEFGRWQICVNTVLPGFMESPMTASLARPVRQAALDLHVLGQFVRLDEAARFIAFLASCRHISGQVIAVDSRIADWG